MGLFSKLKSFMSGTKYRINREILIDYVHGAMKLSAECDLCACDEFYLAADEGSVEEHILISNYDATCKNPMESEKGLKGFIFFVNRDAYYDPEKDEKFYSIEDLIDFKLADYPEWFIMRNDLGAPVELEPYKIK